MMDMEYKVLLTGFEPFGGRDTNVSEEVLSLIRDSELRNIVIHKAILPVSFDKGPEMLRNLAESILPDFIMMLGETSQSDTVRLERIALNFMDSDRGDNYGRRPEEETISETAPAALFTSFPIKEMRDLLRNKGFEVRTSTSAGTYVCNRVYFEGLELARKRGIDALFVHLPVISDACSMDYLKSLILTILNHYRHG